MIDAKLLSEIFDNVAREKLAEEVREWIIHTAPPSVCKIYAEYMQRVGTEDIKIDE